MRRPGERGAFALAYFTARERAQAESRKSSLARSAGDGGGGRMAACGLSRYSLASQECVLGVFWCRNTFARKPVSFFGKMLR